ncbi:MAG: hypothetical protein JWN67_5015 [Actinomycetia bacterium]|nr:hypothetical protein [Actinomycetes bacterium]
MDDASRSPQKGGYPTDLANMLANAMTIWDEAEGLDPGAVPDDPSLAEAIENDWSLAEFLALHISRRPVSERMVAMGMVEAPGHWVETPRSVHARCWREPIAVLITGSDRG